MTCTFDVQGDRPVPARRRRGPARRTAVILGAACLLAAAPLTAQPLAGNARERQFVDSILSLMTLEEKLGQLVQYPGRWGQTGPRTPEGGEAQIRAGLVGSFLGVYGAGYTERLQRIAVEESRLGIPLLFAHDVIHGFRTIFPMPLAEAGSFDPERVERAARIAALEATRARFALDLRADGGRVARSALGPDTVAVRVAVTTTGERAGDEVVQLYVRDDVASVTRPVKELHGFRRIHLPPGERQVVAFRIAVGDLAFHGLDMQRIVEPGTFTVFVGGSSVGGLERRFEVAP